MEDKINNIKSRLVKDVDSLSAEDAANDIMMAFGQVTRLVRQCSNVNFQQALMQYKHDILICLSEHSRHFLQYLPFVIKFSDDEEKCLIARLMYDFDKQGQHVEQMIELCRTNSVDLLTAIGLNNGYPAHFFPELNFNQLIMKLLFSNQDISQVRGLSGRLNDELSRMASDYRQEQINAGRQVPASIELLI